MKKIKKEEYLDAMGKIISEKDHKLRWRMIADISAELNPKVRNEQRKQIKAMAEVRETDLYNSTKAPLKSGLKFVVSMPPLTYKAICDIDEVLEGKSILRFTNKTKYLTRNATNKLARELAEVFPEYKAS